MTAFRYSLPVLKIYNIRYTHYRFLVLIITRTENEIDIGIDAILKRKNLAEISIVLSREGKYLSLKLTSFQVRKSHSNEM